MVAGSVTVVLALGLGLGLGLGLKGHQEDAAPTLDGRDGAAHNPTWKPQVGDSWQIMLSGAMALSKGSVLKPDVAVYNLDLFDNAKETFDELHRRGKKVICYFSGGTYEDWRSDASDMAEDPEDLGDPLGDWLGERWIDIRSLRIRAIMVERIALASQKGCDAIDADNVDGYQNENGLNLQEADAVDFVRFLSTEADKYNMATGLKNAADIVMAVLPVVDFCVNESCDVYDECGSFAPFVDEGKPVFHIEYPRGAGRSRGVSAKLAKEKCQSPGSEGFSTVLKSQNLDGWVEYCDRSIYNTPMIR